MTSYTLEEARVATDGTLSFQQLYQGPATSFEVKGLLPFREYGFRLRACNSAGQGEWSPAYVCQTAPAAPDKPQGLVVSHQVIKPIERHGV